MPKKKKKSLKEATLMDDEFTKFMFNYNPDVPETLIRTVMKLVTGKTDIEFDRSTMTVEKFLSNPYGHSVRFDFYERSTDSEDYILDIQKNKYNFPPKRMSFYLALRTATSLGKGVDYKNLEDAYLIIFSKGDITGHNVPIDWYRNTGFFYKNILDNGQNTIVVNCSHPDFPEEFKELQLLGQDLMEADADRIHNEEIREAFMEINKNEGDDMEKPFYTQFEKLRNEIKDKDKIIKGKDKAIQDRNKIIQDKNKTIQEQSEKLLIQENSMNELKENFGEVLKILEDNNLAFPNLDF